MSRTFLAMSPRSATADVPGKQRVFHFQSKQKVFGQFFTPHAVAQFMVSLSRPFYGIAVDPAVGDGTFLKALMTEGYPIVYGVDIDPEILARCHAYAGRNLQLIQADSLRPGAQKLSELEGRAHLVIGNPPFSSKFGRVTVPGLLGSYALGRRGGTKKAVRRSQALEILFLERFIQLAGKRGQISIILPDGVLANPALQYVRDFVVRETFVKGVVSLPRGLFSHTSSKTHILHLVKKKDVRERQKFPVVLAVAEEAEDLPIIKTGIELLEPSVSPFITLKPVNEVVGNLAPEFHHPLHAELEEELAALPWRCEPLGELLDELRTGGSAYGRDRAFADRGLRYISARTVTWLGIDFSREERFIEPGSRMDVAAGHVRAGDILLVRVGVGCAGRATLVTGLGDKGVANDYIHILRASRVHPGYVALFLQSRLGQRQLARRKHGVGTVSLSHRDLRGVQIPLPGKELQESFGERYRALVEAFVSGRGGAEKLSGAHESLLRDLDESLRIGLPP